MHDLLIVAIVFWNVLPIFVNIILVMNEHPPKDWLNWLSPFTAIVWLWVLKTSPTEEEWERMVAERNNV